MAVVCTADKNVLLNTVAKKTENSFGDPDKYPGYPPLGPNLDFGNEWAKVPSEQTKCPDKRDAIELDSTPG